MVQNVLKQIGFEAGIFGKNSFELFYRIYIVNDRIYNKYKNLYKFE